MARNVVACATTTPLEGVIAEMVKHHIHRIVVVEGEEPVGIISTLDVLSELSG
jgi:CBS domain-containing protein